MTYSNPAGALRERVRGSLSIIDAKSARPARSITAAQTANRTPDAVDVAKLAALEELAVQWRGVLAELAAGVDPATITLPSRP